jgi:fructose-bisphosphate aldolase class I
VERPGVTASGLAETAQALVGRGRGLLAMDESTTTCDKRFAAAGIAQTVQARQDWRELIITTPGLRDFISGVILYDETIRQCDRHGTRFVELLATLGIMPGIKVDLGAKDLALRPGEKITEGLDGLRARLRDYAGMGARFAKWRAVIGLDAGHPSQGCIAANAEALARYAALCQEAGLVPVVEPEVLMAGEHPMQRCMDVTGDVLGAVFDALRMQGVALDAMVLKPNMVLPGLACPRQDTAADIADATLHCLLQAVPASVAGIAFLSGGQTGELASARLNAINAQGVRHPWPLAFSFARAIQQPALGIWRGVESNVPAAQAALHHRARCNHAAMRGEYRATMDCGAPA